jgi:hypothetical protein
LHVAVKGGATVAQLADCFYLRWANQVAAFAGWTVDLRAVSGQNQSVQCAGRFTGPGLPQWLSPNDARVEVACHSASCEWPVLICPVCHALHWPWAAPVAVTQ